VRLTTGSGESTADPSVPINPDLARLAAAAALELAVRRAYSSSSSRDRVMETTLVTVHPRFIWGRRPRANGGRRRPRGQAGFYKYPSVISHGSYHVSMKAPSHLRQFSRR
jgi:hypothetical protein